ncbi:MAG: adenylosuccinate lyase [Mycoplasmoidaceae bacterium]
MKKHYEAPWAERYSSSEMLEIFSNDYKYNLWRKLWISLAESQHEMGLNVTKEQMDELKEHQFNIDYKKVKEYEDKLHHDVMSHIKTYGLLAKNANKIIHLGATSCFVTDNTDLIQIYEAFLLIKNRLINLIKTLSDFAMKYKDTPTLGFTHFQAAQLTTVGKRATLWIQSFLFDLKEVDHFLKNFVLRGIKGATGTGSGFANLFDGDYNKFKKLDDLVIKKMGFKKSIAVSGQTYDRKIDSFAANIINQIAQSAHKFTNDLRLLQHLKEMEEIFEEDQIGSSAMAYKKNPILAERISSISKFILSLSSSPALVSSTQWFERTLDDSANKRAVIPQLFLAADCILILANKISSRLMLYPKMIEKHIAEELPFIASESLLMKAVKKGGNRQELHEIIRSHSMTATKRVKNEGLDNNLIDLLINDSKFPLNKKDILDIMNANNYIGYAIEQTDDFLNNEVKPMLNNLKNTNEKSKIHDKNKSF